MMTEQQVVIIGGSEESGSRSRRRHVPSEREFSPSQETRESCDDYPSIPRHSRIGPLALRPAGIRHD